MSCYFLDVLFHKRDWNWIQSMLLPSHKHLPQLTCRWYTLSWDLQPGMQSLLQLRLSCGTSHSTASKCSKICPGHLLYNVSFQPWNMFLPPAQNLHCLILLYLPLLLLNLALVLYLLSNTHNIEPTAAFTSRTLIDTKRKYPTVEIEALACVWATQKWRSYVCGWKLKLHADHKPLTTLLTTKEFGQADMHIDLQGFCHLLMIFSTNQDQETVQIVRLVCFYQHLILA